MVSPISRDTETFKFSKYIDSSFVLCFIFLFALTVFGVVLLYVTDVSSIICIRNDKNSGICVFSSKTIFEYSKITQQIDTIDSIDWEIGRETTYNVLKIKDQKLIHLKLNIDPKIRKKIFRQFNDFLVDKNAKTFDFTADKRPLFYPIVSAILLFSFLMLTGLVSRVLILFYDLCFRH